MGMAYIKCLFQNQNQVLNRHPRCHLDFSFNIDLRCECTPLEGPTLESNSWLLQIPRVAS